MKSLDSRRQLVLWAFLFWMVWGSDGGAMFGDV